MWKEYIRKLGTWEFMDVKVNFQAYKLWKSWQIQVWFEKEQVFNFWFELWNLRFSLAVLPDADSVSRWHTKLH